MDLDMLQSIAIALTALGCIGSSCASLYNTRSISRLHSTSLSQHRQIQTRPEIVDEDQTRYIASMLGVTSPSDDELTISRLGHANEDAPTFRDQVQRVPLPDSQSATVTEAQGNIDGLPLARIGEDNRDDSIDAVQPLDRPISVESSHSSTTSKPSVDTVRDERN